MTDTVDIIAEGPAGLIERVTTQRNGRYYTADGHTYPSVTTVGDVLRRYSLEQWYKNYTAANAYDMPDVVSAVAAEQGRDAAIKWLAGAADEYRDRRAAIGSVFHAYAEAATLGNPMAEAPDPVGELLARWHDWRARYAPRFLLAEAVVFSDTDNYAGTVDAVAEFDPARFSDEFLAVVLGVDTADVPQWRTDWAEEPITLTIDYTTSKAAYSAKALQVAAYRWADWVALPDGSRPDMPWSDGGAVVTFREADESGPGGWAMWPVRTDETVLAVVQTLRELWQWRHDQERHLVGKPIRQEVE